MEMHYFWVGDKVAQDMYALSWHPGQVNLADYQSKHHIGLHYQAVHPCYLHQSDSPRVLPWALKRSALKGCVRTLNNGYICKVSLPQVPREQSTTHVACTVGKSKSNAFTELWGVNEMCLLTDTVNPHTTGYLPDPRIPVHDNLKRLLLDVSKIVLAPSSPR